MLAFYSKNPFKSIVKATILVLLIKAAVSPQSPITAYVAVIFQGFMGAIIFGMLPQKNVASYLTAIFCLMETAVQKLLVLWVLFGTSFIQSSDAFVADVFLKLGLQINNFSLWILSLYLSIYFFWALYIGFVCTQLPLEMHSRQLKFQNLEWEEKDELKPKKLNKNKKIFDVLFLLVGLSVIYLIAISFKSQTLMAAFYRTLLILFLWWLVSPLIKIVLLWFLNKKRENYARDFSSIFMLLPKLRNKIKPAYATAKADVKGFKVYKEFVFNVIALSLQQDEPKR